jgi:hypothetical protein
VQRATCNGEQPRRTWRPWLTGSTSQVGEGEGEGEEREEHTGREEGKLRGSGKEECKRESRLGEQERRHLGCKQVLSFGQENRRHNFKGIKRVYLFGLARILSLSHFARPIYCSPLGPFPSRTSSPQEQKLGSCPVSHSVAFN